MTRAPHSARRTAPGRVNLIGEHTDYSDGWVLPAAVDLGVTATGSYRRDGAFTFRSSLQDPGDAWLRYPVALLEVLRAAGFEPPGADVHVTADLPDGAGLSSSAALVLAIALVLLDLAGESVDPLRLALLCRDAEEQATGVPPGPMDQIASALSRKDHAMLLDTRALEIELLPLPLAERGLELVIVDTGEKHSLAETSYATRRQETEEAARLLRVDALRDAPLSLVEGSRRALGGRLFRRARHVVTENDRVLSASAALRRGRVEDVGPLLVASHASLRDDYQVSTEALDEAVTASLEAGALGARMTGAGFGGSVLALAPSDRVSELTRRVGANPVLAASGARTFVVRPSDGACTIPG